MRPKLISSSTSTPGYYYGLINGNWAMIISILLLLYLIFCWTFKLDDLPGLHGDEAWFGLKAYHLMERPIEKLTGMNYYTGMLQTWTASFFF